jgi:hypothetical protein
VAEEEQALRLVHRHGPEQNRVHEGDDRGIGADPDGERDNRHDGEAPRTQERAEGVADVAPEILQPRQRALIALPLDRLRHSAGAHAGCSCRGLGRQAAAPLVLGRQLEVRPQLVLEVGVRSRPADRRPQAREPLAHGGGNHSDSRSSACIVDAVRSHCAFSVSSWRRPPAVML